MDARINGWAAKGEDSKRPQGRNHLAAATLHNSCLLRRSPAGF